MKNPNPYTLLVAVATACGLGISSLAQEASPDPSLKGSGNPTEPRQQPSSEASSSARSGVSGASPSSSYSSGQRDQSISSSTSQPPQAGQQQPIPDGLVKHGGAIMFIKNGRLQKVEDEMKLSEGITVQPNGDVELKDGTKMTLQEGQMVTLDSKVTTIPPGAMSTLSGQGAPGDSSSTGTPGTSGAGAGGNTSGSSPGASGVTAPGASSGSSLGSGSNSTLNSGSTGASTGTDQGSQSSSPSPATGTGTSSSSSSVPSSESSGGTTAPQQ